LAAFAVEHSQLMGLFVGHHHLVAQEGIVDGTAATERNVALHQGFSRIDQQRLLSRSVNIPSPTGSSGLGPGKSVRSPVAST
jgi:hypothetical protein